MGFHKWITIQSEIKQMIAYLSGAMENAENDGSAWRKALTIWLNDKLNHSVIDPVVETAQLVKNAEAQNYRDWKNSDPKKFKEFVRKAIDNDLNAVVNKADYLICLWNNDVLAGGGTHGEVTMAYYHNKPVYIINQLDKPNQISGWIMSCATEIFPDFDTLKQRLLEEYGN